MNVQQTIPHPHGVTVFGSYLVRAKPDRARLRFDIRRTHDSGADAFRDAQAAAKKSRELLAGFGDVRTSRVALHTAFEGYGGNAKRLGEQAVIAFDVVVTDLAKLDDLLLAVVDAGADHIHGVTLHTSDMKSLRATARRGAVAAAREKAELYAGAGGVSLGALLHIEDVNPRNLQFQGSHGEDVSVSNITDEATGDDAPENITVAAAVSLTFALAR